MGTQMKLRLSMVWGEEAVRRREEMTEPPEWPTEVSERSEFRREEYRDLPGPDPKRNVDHPDLGYLAVADRNWPRGEDGTCSGREWGWDIERGPTLTPTCTDEMLQVSPRQQADAFLRSVRAAEEGGNELGIEGGMRAMSMTPSPNIPQPPPPPQVSPNPNFALPESCEKIEILALVYKSHTGRGSRFYNTIY